MKATNRSNYAAQSRAAHHRVSLLMYLGVLALWLFACAFEGTGEDRRIGILIFVAGLVMAAVTIGVLIFVPADRENTLKAFKGSMAGYCAFMILMKTFLLIVGNDTTIYGAAFLSGFHSYFVFLFPIGYIVWQAQKFVKLSGVGKTKRQAIDYYKDHGNDGSM